MQLLTKLGEKEHVHLTTPLLRGFGWASSSGAQAWAGEGAQGTTPVPFAPSHSTHHEPTSQLMDISSEQGLAAAAGQGEMRGKTPVVVEAVGPRMPLPHPSPSCPPLCCSIHPSQPPVRPSSAPFRTDG